MKILENTIYLPANRPEINFQILQHDAKIEYDAKIPHNPRSLNQVWREPCNYIKEIKEYDYIGYVLQKFLF